MMTTRSHNHEIELVVSGYVRQSTNQETLFMNLSLDIIDVIFKFFHIALFEWDLHCNERAKLRLELQEDTINSIRMTLSGYTSVVAKKAISSEIYKKCYFGVLF